MFACKPLTLMLLDLLTHLKEFHTGAKQYTRSKLTELIGMVASTNE